MSESRDVLRTLRTSRGWTQADLARKAGVSQSTIRDMENPPKYEKSPYPSTLKRVVDVLGPKDGAKVVRAFGHDEWAETLARQEDGPLEDRLDAITVRLDYLTQLILDLSKNMRRLSRETSQGLMGARVPHADHGFPGLRR